MDQIGRLIASLEQSVSMVGENAYLQARQRR